MNINVHVTFGPSSEVPPWAVELLQSVGLIPQTVKDITMPLSASVQNLVDQVAASKSIEAASAAALVQLVTQSKALSDQVAALTAAGQTMSAEDAAAIAQAASDLHDSAVALQTAVPAGTDPVPPEEAIPPANV